MTKKEPKAKNSWWRKRTKKRYSKAKITKTLREELAKLRRQPQQTTIVLNGMTMSQAKAMIRRLSQPLDP